MSRRPRLAPPGSLDPRAYAAVDLFAWWNRRRDALVAGLLKLGHAPSRRRDELIRQIILRFGAGEIGRISDYQKAMKDYGCREAIKSELDLLARAGLICLSRSETDKRAVLVKPSAHLVEWYNANMPCLISEILERLRTVHNMTPEAEYVGHPT